MKIENKTYKVYV